MKKTKPMSKINALFLLIAGFIMGTVFIFGMQYWNAPIPQEKAICTSAIFSSYDEYMKNGQVQEIIVRFEDHEQLHIDGVCINQELRNNIESISPGTVVSLIVHPNSNTIMELQAGGSVFLEFQDTSEKLARETEGFTYLGLICYSLSMYGLFSLVFRQK